MDIELALTSILVVVTALLVLSQFTRVPYPILLVLGGLGLGLLPPIPDVDARAGARPDRDPAAAPVLGRVLHTAPRAADEHPGDLRSSRSGSCWRR